MAATGTHPLVGETVDGRYRVLRHIADGGMASVLLATDLRLEREVALKVMRPDLTSDERLVARFRREARSAARLSHPNVVPVYDQGEHDGLVFLAMEHVEGRTAREVVDDEGALTPRAALDILEPVLTGLAAAHEAGYIHRDVKPENVLIPERGPVKVADFGLARAVTSQTTTANEGVLFGTVSYLSPEQVERGVADPRSDVYAAGLLLFELLTGTTAIDGETPIHVAFQHVHGGVPAPSSRSAGLSPLLDELVAAATAIDPDERPRDAGAYLEQVRRARADLTPEELDSRPAVAAPAPRGAATVAHPRPTPTRAISEAEAAGSTAAGSTAAGSTAVVPTDPRDGMPGRTSARVRRRRVLAVLLALVLLLASAGSWYALAGPGSRTTVPEVAGLDQAAVEDRLAESDLDLNATQAFDEQVPAGEAISSRPGTGSEVGKGSDIAVTFSKGPERYAVPDLSGRTRDQAGSALDELNLAVGEVTEAWDEEVPAGQVVSSDPESGVELRRDDAVDLVISKGPEPITVPSVTGQGFDDATATLEDLGLEVDRADDAFSSSVPKGSVATQDPATGQLYRGDTVTLTVSKGPEMVDVPSVEGLSKAAATDKLEKAGFTVKVQTFLGGVLDEVRAADPQAGTSAPKGSTVTILVV